MFDRIFYEKTYRLAIMRKPLSDQALFTFFVLGIKDILNDCTCHCNSNRAEASAKDYKIHVCLGSHGKWMRSSLIQGHFIQ